MKMLAGQSESKDSLHALIYDKRFVSQEDAS